MIPLRAITVSIILALVGSPPAAMGADGSITPGTKFDSLSAAGATYRDVVIRSVNRRTATITHSGGMTSIPLAELSPELQARFNYDPAAAAAADAAEAAKAGAAPNPPVARPRAPSSPKGLSQFDALLRKFGQPAVVTAEVDLRPKFFKLELHVKNQGVRPSCAVFAVVSALEFQNAERSGKIEEFSEEYLIWAVRKSVRRMPVPGVAAADAGDDGAYRDEGFSLGEVVAALRAYGIPLQASLPNTFSRRGDTLGDPPAAIVQEAREHQRVFAHQVPGRDRATLLNNIVHSLNAGVPVAVGMGWPAGRVANGYLNSQKAGPNAGHAVTLVGYKSKSERLEDAYFIFKNSWGPAWGQGGYGTVTSAYLLNNLQDAVLLEVQSG